jgi:hypothetical protein
MQTKAQQLRPVLNEVHRAAHNQDLTEVPKRALLDRESENHEIHLHRTRHGEDRTEREI